MTKKKDVFSRNPAFKGSTQSSFNLVPKTNNMDSFFQVQELDQKEKTSIEKLLVDYYAPEKREEKDVTADLQDLSQMTAEIKAIGKQGLLLIGERVAKAREILKSYRDGAFTKWLEGTFGSIRTGYNMLGYYELYHALPEDSLREYLKKIPQKVVYILASRNGALETKADIIREYHDLRAEEFIMLIREKLPSDLADNRGKRTINQTLIEALAVS